ncbi:MAG: hypothetical protein ABIS47_02805 [Acidimicrobiales bacterium]
MGEDGARQPVAVGVELPGVELPGRAVLHAGASFQGADGQVDGGVITVELVHGHDGQVDAGVEIVVTPVGPQGSLGPPGEPGGAEDQTQPTLAGGGTGHVDGLGDLGFAARRVGDRCPCRVVDGVDGVDGVRMAGLMRTVIDQATPSRLRVSISS